GVYVRCIFHHRSLLSPPSAPHGPFRPGSHLCVARAALSPALSGKAHACSCSCSHCLLCDVSRSGHMGRHRGDLSQPNSKQCRFHCCYSALVGMFSTHILVSSTQCRARSRRNVLDLCSGLSSGRRVSFPAPAGDQRKNSRRNRDRSTNSENLGEESAVPARTSEDESSSAHQGHSSAGSCDLPGRIRLLPADKRDSGWRKQRACIRRPRSGEGGGFLAFTH